MKYNKISQLGILNGDCVSPTDTDVFRVECGGPMSLRHRNCFGAERNTSVLDGLRQLNRGDRLIDRFLGI